MDSKKFDEIIKILAKKDEWEYSDYSQIDAKAKEHFPFKKARKNQLETISEIKDAIDKGYKYIVLEAGTGTGKSAIAATLASMYDSTYILTVTKQLQDQYLKDFENLGFKLVKGRNNFMCRKYAEDNIKNSCDEGRCILEGYKCEYSIKNKYGEDITSEGTCHYDYQKFLGLISKVVISNYHYLFLELNYVQDFTKRNLMIFDEAHKLEESIMSLLKLEFSRKELKEHVGINLSKETIRDLNGGNYKTWINFIERIKGIYVKELDKIKGLKNRPELNAKILYLKKRIDDCNIFIRHINHDPEKWIFDYDSYWGIAEFKPIKVDNYAKDTFLKYGDVCIFMSATILDYKLFAEWLGLNETEIYAIRQKSPFEVNRNPIKTFKKFNMSYANLQDSAPQTLDAINEILEKHKNDKGIIHTVSYQCKNYLKRNIGSPRFIDHKTKNRTAQLKKFRESKKPLVLISPSMGEGVDLPGDLCRFQIIYKIPYPNVSDKQTSLRMKMDSKWFKYKTSLSLVQTLGRGMRYEDDYCITYFIDSRLKSYVLNDQISNHFLPESFVDAIDIEPAKIEVSKDEEVNEDESNESESSEYDYLFERVMSVKPSESEGIVRTIDEVATYRAKINSKYEMILEGKKLIDEDEIRKAIEFHEALLSNELFENDYYPYLKLAELYESNDESQKEAEIITRFFKSGIFARKTIIKKFIKRLYELSKTDYIGPCEIDKLKDEYSRNGKLNKRLPAGSVPASYYIIKTNKNVNRKGNPFNPDSFRDIINQEFSISNEYKLDLILVGDRLMGRKEYDRVIAYYEALLSNPLFVNDYYLYRKLAIAYHKNHQYNDEVDVIVEFYSSGIYCDEDQLKWFRKQLEKTSRYGNFDYSLMEKLKKQFEGNGALNEENVDIPVLSAYKIKNMQEPLEIIKKPKVKHKEVKTEEYYSREYFNKLADEVKRIPGFVSDRDLLKHADEDFMEIKEYHDEIDQKADLKNKGKELEKDDELEAIKFYDGLKKDSLFENDYYPYRRQCILFKNRIKNDQSDWDTIVEIFGSKIYLNEYQMVWLKNKIHELIEKLKIDSGEIDKLLEGYDENMAEYMELQYDSIPIAERIFKDETGLRLLSSEKYDRMQHIFYVKELGVGYIRRGEYETAIRYYADLLKSDFLYYRYHAYKQLGRIVSEMDDQEEFKRIYDDLIDG